MVTSAGNHRCPPLAAAGHPWGHANGRRVPPTHAPRWPPENSAVLLSAEFSPWSAPLRKLELIGRRADVARVLVLQEILKIDTAIWASVKKQAHAQVVRLVWHHAWEKKKEWSGYD